MKALAAAVTFLAGVGTAIAAKPAKKAVLIGTVTAIEELRTEFSVDRLAITVAVDKVVTGSLTDASIRFVLPVVAKDLMEVGGTYEIQAKRTPDGYVVGEADIRRIKSAPGAKPSKDLLLVVTVTAMKDTDELRKPWLVSTKVVKVLSGELPGGTFQFAIHSPAQAGLKVGNRYTIPAHWTGDAYEVDELDVWRHNH
jgi:hypothetical protein